MEIQLDEMKELNYKSQLFGDIPVIFDIQQYMMNGNMYIGLVSKDEDGYLEPYSDLTVNLDRKVPDYCAYVDVNNMPEAEKFISENELGYFTGLVQRSGYCMYPLYSFNADKLRELCPEGMRMYENTIGKSQTMVNSIKQQMRSGR